MRRAGDNRVLLTGATGFLGHYVLAELLARGVRCVVLLRPPVETALARLTNLLAELDVDAQRHFADGSIKPIAGELPNKLPDVPIDSISTVIHAAAATNFRRDARGEPHHTNVDGTRALLDWVSSLGLRRVQLVSSAYTCGRASGSVAEAFNPNPAAFHNDYERSKWESERLVVDWARRRRGEVTILRPSIIVGAFRSGRATKFGGVYLSVRATELLDRMHRDQTPGQRQSIPLRIIGRPLDRQNIVPVDYVAKMIVAAVTTPKGGGNVYNLVHADPPSNLQIKQALERRFNIGGGRFVAPEELVYDELNELERSFYDVIRPIEHYFVDTPAFCRTNAAALEDRAGITCPRYDEPAIGRLVRYAQATSWGRRTRTTAECAAGCAAYFESFLPFHVGKSEVARMTALSATVSFVIEDEPEGRWVCTFDRGRLTRVRRGTDGQREDFGYRATRKVFWESISGRRHPQELFLTGGAEMFGNLEQALKMSMVLHAFTKEYPCDPQTLARYVEESCLRS